MNFTKLHPNAIIPSRTHDDDIGLDLYAIEDYLILPNSGIKARTGIALEISSGKGGLIWDKSSLAWKKDSGKYVKVCGGAIDPQYRGEIFIVLFNMNKYSYVINKGDAIAQLIIINVCLEQMTEVTELTETRRGNKGFGEGSIKKEGLF